MSSSPQPTIRDADRQAADAASGDGDSTGSRSFRTGLADFLACQSEGGFVLMAVAAPAPMVTACLADSWGPENVMEDAEVRAASTADGSGPARLVTIVQLRDTPWTIVFEVLSDVAVEHVLALSDRAADLSRTLSVEALVFSAETLDGDASYELWQDGERVERALWTVADSVHRFDSKLRGEPPGPPDLDLPEDLFAERGIHVPACRPFTRDGEVWLEVARLDAADVEHVDLIDLGGRSTVSAEWMRLAMEKARAQASEKEPDAGESSIFRSVLDLMGRVFH